MRAYGVNRAVHFDVCRSYQVSAPAGQEDHAWSHDGWELAFSPSQFYTSLRGMTHRCSGGEFLLFNAREEHTEIYPRDRDSRYSVLVFTDTMLAELLEDSGVNPNELLFNRVLHRADPDLQRLIGGVFALRELRNSHRFTFECLAAELVLKLLATADSTGSSDLNRARNLGVFPSNLARARRLIAENLTAADFSLADLAREAGISKFHLVRSFKDRTGLSPIQYRNAIRIELAKSLLARGARVGEVATQLGFNTFSTFNKAFKRQLGMPPERYRFVSER